jgi:hypothetical protein
MSAALFFAIFIPLVVTGFALHAMFVARLRALYPDVWKSLGEPNLLLNDSRQSFATAKYIVKGNFRALDNSEFVRFCQFVRFFDISYLIGFTILLVVSLSWGFYSTFHGR